MRTGRSLTVCWSLLPGGEGACLLQRGWLSAPVGSVHSWGVSALGGGVFTPRGVSALGEGGVCSQGVSGLGVSAPRGVCSRGVCSGGCLLLGGLLGGCLLREEGVGVSASVGVYPWGCLLGGCLLRGVSALGGLSALGGVCSWGACGIPACTKADTPLWTEWQTGAKILPWPQLRCGR